jgi:hypothetical protein
MYDRLTNRYRGAHVFAVASDVMADGLGEGAGDLWEEPEGSRGRLGLEGEEGRLKDWQRTILKVRLRRQEITEFLQRHRVQELIERVKGLDSGAQMRSSLNLQHLLQQVRALDHVALCVTCIH